MTRFCTFSHPSKFSHCRHLKILVIIIIKLSELELICGFVVV
jgi:hypothetical protein